MRALTLILLVGSRSFAAAADVRFGLGLGFAAHLQRGPNPANETVFGAPLAFANLGTGAFTFGAEYQYARRSSGAGGVSVGLVTRTALVYTRYGFYGDRVWTPFVSLGLGADFDRVTSTYADATSSVRGQRGILAAGAGVGWLLFERWSIDTEIRVESIADQRAPDFDGALRMGWEF